MAFTFEDFKREAEANGIYGDFSAADLNLAKQNPDVGMSLLSYKKDYRNAPTDDARALANAGANGLRKSYGNFDGGSDGNDYYLQERAPNSYKPHEYTSPYAGQMAGQLDKVMGSSFAYDEKTDPNVGAYKKMYAREGERATKNAMGQAASMTGGIPSTAAMTAGAQAGQYYGAKLADKVPELRQQAYSEYMQGKNADLAILSAMQNLDSNDYNKYSTDRSFGYNQNLADLDYRTGKEQTEYEREIYAKEQERKKQEQVALDMAALGDFSFYNQLYGGGNLSPEQLERLTKGWAIQDPKLAYGLSAPQAQTYSGGGGGTKKVIDTDKKPTTVVPDSMKTTITLGDVRKMYQEATKAKKTPQEMLEGLNKAKASGAYTEADYRLMLEVFTNPGMR